MGIIPLTIAIKCPRVEIPLISLPDLATSGRCDDRGVIKCLRRVAGVPRGMKYRIKFKLISVPTKD